MPNKEILTGDFDRLLLLGQGYLDNVASLFVVAATVVEAIPQQGQQHDQNKNTYHDAHNSSNC